MTAFMSLTLLLAAAADAESPAAVVLAAKGAVAVTRGDGKPRPLELGDLVLPGDLLESSGGEATLYFRADGRRQRLKPGKRATAGENGCDPAEAVEEVETDNAPTKKQREGVGDHIKGAPVGNRVAIGILRSDADVPAVTPMYEARVLTDHPTISWPGVEKTEWYEATLLSGQGPNERLVWRAETRGTSLPYPEDEKVLSPGRKYRWQVTARLAGGKRQEVVKESVFFVAGEEQIAESASLRRMAASADAGDRLVAALVYESWGAYDKALPLYEGLAKESPDVANLWVVLANYYDRAGAGAKAKAARETARKLGAAVPEPEPSR